MRGIARTHAREHARPRLSAAATSPISWPASPAIRSSGAMGHWLPWDTSLQVETVAIPRAAVQTAVAAIDRWLKLAGIQPGEPLLRRVRNSGEIGSEVCTMAPGAHSGPPSNARSAPVRTRRRKGCRAVQWPFAPRRVRHDGGRSRRHGRRNRARDAPRELRNAAPLRQVRRCVAPVAVRQGWYERIRAIADPSVRVGYRRSGDPVCKSVDCHFD